jgi:hypothetical protein
MSGVVMRKVLLGAVAALTLVLVVAPTGVASAGAHTGTTQVTIKSQADYDFVGTTIDVGLEVRCSGGSGSVIVDLEQFPPETPYPVATGSGPQIVTCDGRTRSVAVTVAGFGFDAGKAKATATLTTPSGSVQAQRWITIVAV